MKSILIFTGIYPPDIGGPATFVPQFEEFLQSRDHEFHTVLLSDSLGKSEEFRKRASVVSRNLWLPLRVCKVVLAGLRASRNMDVILANGLYEEAALVSLFSRKPLVCKVVGNPAWESLQMIKLNDASVPSSLERFDLNQLPLSLRVRYWWWKLALSRATSLIAPSHSFKRHLENLKLGLPIYVVENGTFIPERENEQHSYDVVTVSRLVPWKNLDIIIQAAKEYDFSLAVVGDGPDLLQLRAQANGDSRIVFLGRMEPSRIGRLLHSSRVYALISTYEGLSYSLIEALAHGKACVVSENLGNLDALGESHSAIVVPVRDVTATGKAIRELLDDCSLRESFEAKARHLAVEKYDMFQQLQEILDTIYAVS
jgi:glycosyltransferase involved in cell wall biosynthesis